jgi:hypothetical protein
VSPAAAGPSKSRLLVAPGTTQPHTTEPEPTVRPLISVEPNRPHPPLAVEIWTAQDTRFLVLSFCVQLRSTPLFCPSSSSPSAAHPLLHRLLGFGPNNAQHRFASRCSLTVNGTNQFNVGGQLPTDRPMRARRQCKYQTRSGSTRSARARPCRSAQPVLALAY